MKKIVQITHGELQNGDINIRVGIRFRVSNLRTLRDLRNEATGEIMPYVRFNGEVVDRNNFYAGTQWDGGIYGAYCHIPTSIEERS